MREGCVHWVARGSARFMHPLNATPITVAAPGCRSLVLAWALCLACVSGCIGDRDDVDQDASPVTILDADLDSEADLDADRLEPDDPDLDAAVDDEGEAGLDADRDAEAGLTEPPSNEGNACQSDADCDDKVFCNGQEVCASARCQRSSARPCSAVHVCVEGKRACDCDFPDADRDGWDATECGGKDCDDGREYCRPGGKEVCDTEDRDEDCRPETYNQVDKDGRSLDGDADRDGYVAASCRNFDARIGDFQHGPDCDDHNASVKPGNTEACNYADDDCDGLIDELDDPKAGAIAGGLMITFVPDLDGDKRADQKAKPVRECDFYQPRGYIDINSADANDCDDRNAQIYAGAPEICDGFDNDCDGKTDNADDDLTKPIVPATQLSCTAGAWTIAANGCPEDKTWCPGDDVHLGCARDATRLSSCRQCQTRCEFSCGRRGCDEVVEIVTGAEHACARTGEGRIACWGRGADGRLGIDSVGQTSVPTYVVGISDARGMAAGAGHTCAIVGDERSLYCWGRNQSGQLGNGDAGAFTSTPVPVVGMTGGRLVDVVQVAAGLEHTCAILGTGTLVCFGSTAGGRLGNGVLDAQIQRTPTQAIRNVFVPDIPFPLPEPVSDAKSLAVGSRHSCIITQDGSVDCWGDNDLGQLAQSQDAVSDGLLVRVAQVQNASEIAAGAGHSCALLDGVPFCWGADANLQLGRGSAPDRQEGWIPKPAAGLSELTQIAVGAQFSCGRGAGGAVRCWGANAGGQLGPAATGVSSSSAVTIPAPAAARVSCGGEYACVLTSGNTASCWGQNALGQVGIRSLEQIVRIPSQLHYVISAVP